MPHPAPPVLVYVKRDASLPALFSLRFAARQGRGMLRVDRDGVAMATPAQVRGFVEDLSLDALQGAELVWTAGDARRSRSVVGFGGLASEDLEELEIGDWHPLQLTDDGDRFVVTLEEVGEGRFTAEAIALGGSLEEERPPDTEEVARDSVPAGLMVDVGNTAAETSTLTDRLAQQGTVLAEWLADHEHPEAPAAWRLLQGLDGLRLAALEHEEAIRQLKERLTRGP